MKITLIAMFVFSSLLVLAFVLGVSAKCSDVQTIRVGSMLMAGCR